MAHEVKHWRAHKGKQSHREKVGEGNNNNTFVEMFKVDMEVENRVKGVPCMAEMEACRGGVSKTHTHTCRAEIQRIQRTATTDTDGGSDDISRH